MDSQFYDIGAPLSLAQVAEMVGSAAVGSTKITGVNSLETAGESEISYLDFSVSAKGLDKSAEIRAKLAHCKAGACLVKAEAVSLLPSHIVAVEVLDPKMAFITLVDYFYKDKSVRGGVSPLASVASSAKLGAGVSVAAYAVIEEGCEIGDGCVIKANAVISHTIMGKNCVIAEGAVLGGDGFGWHSGAFGHKWMPQLGRVVLGDDVWIGANTTVDRGTFGDTSIGSGTKLDNLVHIGHNCVIGKNCIMAAMSGIAGSTVLEDWVLVGGQAGISGHLRIGAGSQLGAGAGVIQNLAPKSFVSGYPAQPVKEWLRQSVIIKKLGKK